MFRTSATTSSRTIRRVAVQARPFSLTTARKVEADDKHSINKVKEGDVHNIHESNMKSALDAEKKGDGGNATGGGDKAGGQAKAKKEFPEAPDPAIGMQDERGGKGA